MKYKAGDCFINRTKTYISKINKVDEYGGYEISTIIWHEKKIRKETDYYHTAKMPQERFDVKIFDKIWLDIDNLKNKVDEYRNKLRDEYASTIKELIPEANF